MIVNFLKKDYRSIVRNLISKCKFWPFIWILEVREYLSINFVTYIDRPKLAKNFLLNSDKLKTVLPKIAIIIQGPLKQEENFTFETVKIYKKLFPGVLLIVSTWEGEDELTVTKIRNEEVEVLLNKKPAFPGQQNINFQIVSSRNGIALAKKMGAQYATKTRSDQRINAPNVLEAMVNLQKIFPLKNVSAQKQRIIVPSLDTLRYRLYGVSDMFVFGDIDDMDLYWSAELDNRPAKVHPRNISVREMGMGRICEVYLCTEFLKKIGRKVEWTLEDSWKVYAEHFCVIDQEMLDIYWFKPVHFLERKFSSFFGITNRRLLTFSDWLNLCCETNKRVVPEKTLDLTLDEKVPD